VVVVVRAGAAVRDPFVVAVHFARAAFAARAAPAARHVAPGAIAAARVGPATDTVEAAAQVAATIAPTITTLIDRPTPRVILDADDRRAPRFAPAPP
jgi:hypothetical protein